MKSHSACATCLCPSPCIERPLICQGPDLVLLQELVLCVIHLHIRPFRCCQLATITQTASWSGFDVSESRLAQMLYPAEVTLVWDNHPRIPLHLVLPKSLSNCTDMGCTQPLWTSCVNIGWSSVMLPDTMCISREIALDLGFATPASPCSAKYIQHVAQLIQIQCGKDIQSAVRKLMLCLELVRT